MYTYSDSEPEQKKPILKYTLFTFVALFVIFCMVLIGIGLSRGEELAFTEFSFDDASSQDDPTASCLGYHKSVLSTTSIYDEFVDDCGWLEDTLYPDGYFSEGVYVLYFVKDTVLDQPLRFFDYPFLIDDNEIIRVRDRRWREPDGSWYIYFIEMEKDQIETADITFD